MRVLLLYPNMHGMNMIPSAIGLFSSLLKREGHKVDLFDSTNWVIPGEENFDSDKVKEKNLNMRPFDDSLLRSQVRVTDVFEDFEKKVKEFKPDLIAASVSEDIFPIGISLLKKVRYLKIPTIMGGVFPTFAPGLCLSYDEVDMICVGEGESAIVELCRRMEKDLSYSDINNIWVKKGGAIKKNPMGPLTDVDKNPLLDLSYFDDSRLYRPMQGRVWRMLPVETHRGCPYRCAYCNSPSQFDLYRKEVDCTYFRKKSFAAIRKELVYYRDVIKAEAYYFWADTFMVYNDREFDEFVEMYSDIRLPFWCQAFPDTIKENRIKRLMEVGLFRLASGVEHGNEEFRARMLRRKVKNQVMIDSFKILNKLGLPYSVNNIMGFPMETKELAMDTVELNRHIDADSANAYSFSPFHGTPLRKICEEMGFCKSGMIARSVTKPTLLNMPQFPPEAIEGLRRCFILYVKMPKTRWRDIEKAEKFTPEGDRIWSELRDECAEKYMNFSKEIK
jgi:anaerobic magnesium-protoporphyrin IX monomethyl ester cyclase